MAWNTYHVLAWNTSKEILGCRPAFPHLQGFAKLDLLASQTQTECAVATVEFEDQAWGGEPLFVPRSQDIESCRGRSLHSFWACMPCAAAIYSLATSADGQYYRCRQSAFNNNAQWPTLRTDSVHAFAAPVDLRAQVKMMVTSWCM